MMRSLRARHLLNGIVIIIMGIIVLGALLSLSIYQSKTEAVSEELERTALDLLGYLEYENGTFAITEPNRADSEIFLNERKLRTSGKERFAYLWDAEQQKIIWDSLDNNDVDQQELQNNFALFDFEELLKNIDMEGQSFSPAQAKSVESLPQADGEKPVQYLVATQSFTVNFEGGKQNYLFVVATSMADVETETDDLISTLLLSLLITAALLLITQLIFSWWVMSPIREFEKEALAIGNGKKSSFGNDYPNELKSIQHVIKTLLKHKS